jgi:integrase
MALIKRGRKWYLSYWPEGRKGKHVRVALGTDKKGIAQERAQVILARVKAPVNDHHINPSLTLHTAIDDYITSVRPHKKSAVSDEKLASVVKQLFTDRNVHEIRPSDIEIYREGRRAGKLCVPYKSTRTDKGPLKDAKFTKKKKPVKDSTINREVDFLRAVYKRLNKLGLCTVNPVKDIENYSEKKLIRNRVLSAKEFDALYKECAEHIKPICLIAYHTGMRKGEIFDLTLKDLTPTTIYIPKERSKNGEERLIPLVLFPPVLELIESILLTHKGQPQDTRIFPGTTFKRGFVRACERAKVIDFTFHDFRHTAITNMQIRGFPEKIIMMITGHKTRSAFDRYVNLKSKDLLDFARIHNVYPVPNDKR